MGQAKHKQHSREKFLSENPTCAYCGAPATTVDHCPPRCLFENREWPESYEFPACKPCNDLARLDEQALGVLVRPRLAAGSQRDLDEWKRLVTGVMNNQPALASEWMSLTASGRKRALRGVFGLQGDKLRHDGWSCIYVGPLTQGIIDRFIVRLGQALYYRHNGEPLDGAVYGAWMSLLESGFTPAFRNGLLEMAPGVALPTRAKKSLKARFAYRFNHSAEHGAMYAVAEFSEQFVFQIIALSWQAEQQILEMARSEGLELPLTGRHECSLKYTRRPSIPDTHPA